MHAGRIKDSKRHQRIIRAMMEADRPLSGGEITNAVVQLMVAEGISLNAALDQSPQAVSTTIGEMRSEDNRADGYIVSYATYWKIARPGGPQCQHQNKDGSVSFYIAAARYPWHDARPRYWLIAAPGWTPRWRITDAGLLVPHSAAPGHEEPWKETETRRCGDTGTRGQESEPRLCAAPGCDNFVVRSTADPFRMTCSAECNAAWRESLRPKFSQEPQGNLL